MICHESLHILTYLLLFATPPQLFPPLLIYAVLYNVIPAVRFAVLSTKNAEIVQRNRRRSEWYVQCVAREGGCWNQPLPLPVIHAVTCISISHLSS